MPAAPLYDLRDVPAGGNALFVAAADGTQIRVAFWKGGDRGTVLLFPGRTEYIEKYGRVISRLQERNLNVVVIDWRGQGLSDRTDGRLDRGYVANFLDYQQDIAAALAAPEIAALKGPRLLFSHSMGGCIGLRAMVDGLDIKAAIFSSPMWGFTAPLATVLLVKTLDFIGLGKSLAPGMKPGFYVLDDPFEGNEMTNDPDHYAMFRDHLETAPSLGLGGPTIHWAVQTEREMAQLFKTPFPDIPTLIFKVEQELVVDPEAISAMAAKMPNGRLEVVNSKHEVWMETPDIQDHVWQMIDDFLTDIL